MLRWDSPFKGQISHKVLLSKNTLISVHYATSLYWMLFQPFMEWITRMDVQLDTEYVIQKMKKGELG